MLATSSQGGSAEADIGHCSMVPEGSIQSRHRLSCPRWDWWNVLPKVDTGVWWLGLKAPCLRGSCLGVCPGPGDTAISGTHSYGNNAKINPFQRLFE